MTLHLPLDEQPDGLPVHPLGLRFAPPDPHNLLFARYATALAPPPPRKDYEHPVASWPTYLNDSLGDCVPAGVAHATQIVTAGAVQVTDDDVLHAYEQIGGYRPGDPATDRGCVELDALKWWRKVGIAGHRIDAFVSVDPHDHAAVKKAIDLLGVVLYGIALPLAAQGKRAWSKPRNLAGRNAPGSWGGHCLAPNTRVLTDDLRWKPLGDVLPGEGLVGFDEEKSPTGRRQYRRAVVESVEGLRLPCYDLHFEDGSTVRSSDDHLWLTDSARSWVRTDRLRPLRVQRSSSVVKYVEPWELEDSWVAGYLAAAFDGEGWLSTGGANRGFHRLGFTQRTNAMWECVTRELKELGYNFSTVLDRSGFPGGAQREPINSLMISGRNSILRLLGTTRPQRLLDIFSADRLGTAYGTPVRLLRREYVGEQDVVAIGTTTKTFVAEGFGAHNCVVSGEYDAAGVTTITWGETLRMSWGFHDAYVQEVWAPLALDWCGSGLSPSGFDLATLRADLAAL